MNNLLLLGLGVVVLFLVMNGSNGKGKSGSLEKSVSKVFKGNSILIIVAVGAVVLFMCMNKRLVEGAGTPEDNAPTKANIGDELTIGDKLNNMAEGVCQYMDPTSEYNIRYDGASRCATCLVSNMDLIKPKKDSNEVWNTAVREIVNEYTKTPTPSTFKNLFFEKGELRNKPQAFYSCLNDEGS